MIREKYFQKMKETSRIVNPLIIGAIEPLKNVNKDLYDFITNIPAFKKRLEKKEKLRPFLLRLAYELVGGKNWKKIAPVCASMELLNISTYIDNTVFDNKNNIKDNEKTNYIISARIIRDIAEDLLKKSSKRYRDRLLELFIEIDKDIYIAQFENINQLRNYKDFDTFEAYYKKYLHRCEWITGRFMENICKIGAILSNGIEEQIKDLGEIGRNIGIIVQIINDLGDFVPPEEKVYDYEKVYKDQFSDMRYGKLTLPIYYVLEYGNKSDKEKIKKVFGNNKSKNKDMIKVIKVLVDTGAIEYAKDLAIEYTKKTKKLLKEFNKSEARDQLNILSTMSRTNKYLARIKEKFGESKIKKDYLVLVDEDDKLIGVEEKLKAHRQGKLHRAFSIFIFNSKGELLIQKRAKNKYHSGDLWSNTVCSHQKPQESLKNAAHRRLKEEMGFDCPLKKIGKFHYIKEFNNSLIENEIDHLFFGHFYGEVKLNLKEASEIKWISFKILKENIKKNPQNYTFWLNKIVNKYGEKIVNYENKVKTLSNCNI